MGHYHAFKYPEAPIPELNFLTSQSVAEALGHVIMSFENVDEMVSTGIAFLLNQSQEAGDLVTAPMSFRQKLDLLAALLRGEKHAVPYLEQLDALIALCKRASELRNELVHSKWEAPFESDEMVQRRTTRGKQGVRRHEVTFAPYQIQHLAWHFNYVQHCIDKFMYRIYGNAYGNPWSDDVPHDGHTPEIG